MSKLPFELMLALRYLRPKRTFVSIITLICIVGVTLGVAVLIVVMSVMTGFDRELRTRIIGFNPHLRLTTSANLLSDYAEIVKQIKALPEVKEVAPYVLAQVLVETRPFDGSESYMMAPFVRGVNPKLETNMTVLPSSIVAGEFDLRGNRVVIGSGMAGNLKLAPGDLLAVHSPRDLRRMKESRNSEIEEVTTEQEYRVAGIFDVGYYEYNANFLLASLGNAQDLYDLDDQVHGLMIFLHDPERAGIVQEQLLQNLNAHFVVTTWMDENGPFLDALLVEKSVMFYILFFIMVVAAFGITSALITFVVQKTREIGMLKAVGATSGQIMWLFLSQSLMVGVLGVAAGYGLGMLAVTYRNEFLRLMNRLTGFELFPAQIYNFNALPALIVPRDIAVICVASLFICLLAGLLPAWNAGRLKPVEALRHE